MSPATPAPPAPPIGPPAGPAPGASPSGGWGTGLRIPEPAVAGLASQLAVFACTALAIGLVFAAGGHSEFTVPCLVALTVGILLGRFTPAGAFVERASGAALSVATGVLLIVVLGLLASQGEMPPPIIAVLGALVVLGMDWRLVSRLRILPLASGLLVVVTVGLERGWAYPAAVVWFVVAIGALWLLEDDRRRGLDRPEPPEHGPAPAAPNRPVDAIRTIGLGLLIGLAAAFVLGNPSCSPWTPDSAPRPPDIGNRNLPDPGLGDPTEGGRFTPTDQVPQERRLEGNGQERAYDIDEFGNRTFTDPATGETYTVNEEGGRTVVRDSKNRPVADLEYDGVAVGGTGRGRVVYQQDSLGRVYTDGTDGRRLYLERTGERTVLRTEDGTIVAEGGADADDLTIADPEGIDVVPDRDRDGRVPVPNGAVVDGAFSPYGRTVTYGDGRTVVTDRDGERRTYDTDPQGRERVKIERPGEPARSFAYEDRGTQTDVYEYDEDGKLVRRYRYDPNGLLVDPSGDVGGTSVDPNDPDQQTVPPEDESTEDEQDEDRDKGDIPWAWIGGGAVLLAALVAFGIWWSRRPKPEGERPWAEEQVRRIDAFGAAHGRARGAAETPLEHTRRLAGSVAPDDRLPDVGRALSDALFGRTGIGPERQAWVEATLDEITEAHPPPGWNDRRKAKKGDPVPTP